MHKGEQEWGWGLGVGVWSKSRDKNKKEVKADGGQMGLQPQHMCCATMCICVPIYQVDTMSKTRSVVRAETPESVGVDWS